LMYWAKLELTKCMLKEEFLDFMGLITY